MHSKGIVHRDIKAENVLFKIQGTTDITVKVCDFGLSRKLDDGKDHYT
jgi:calcium/calmodulin-dependent protein kinase I